ncbi:MAG: biotin--[acetyl-CoA-carboxylase] ligase [Gammaproteobacteria bacterium]
MSTQQLLFRLIADGQIHSGRDLAAQLGVSRTAVWKQLKGLQSLGVVCDAIPGKGYQIGKKVELLERDEIMGGLRHDVLETLDLLEVLWNLPSTNDYLLDAKAPDIGKARVCVAEYQSGGRGRRGRKWQSPLGSGVYMSLSWQFAEVPRDFAALGLVAGIGVTRALARTGVTETVLKWPNDVLLQNGKLAGILVEVRGEPDGPMHAVIGTGVNCIVSREMRDSVVSEGGLHPVGLFDEIPAAEISRNELAAAILEEIALAVRVFERDGFMPFSEEWKSRDALLGREVNVQMGNATISGAVQGLTDDGRLSLRTANGIQNLSAGEVSLRSVP